jgi:hypothetical protein
MSQLEHACRLRCGGLAISRDDIEFLRNAASRVAQGLRAARLLVRFESPPERPDEFQPLSRWSVGVILLDSAG